MLVQLEVTVMDMCMGKIVGAYVVTYITAVFELMGAVMAMVKHASMVMC